MVLVAVSGLNGNDSGVIVLPSDEEITEKKIAAAPLKSHFMI